MFEFPNIDLYYATCFSKHKSHMCWGCLLLQDIGCINCFPSSLRDDRVNTSIQSPKILIVRDTKGTIKCITVMHKQEVMINKSPHFLNVAGFHVFQHNVGKKRKINNNREICLYLNSKENEAGSGKSLILHFPAFLVSPLRNFCNGRQVAKPTLIGQQVAFSPFPQTILFFDALILTVLPSPILCCYFALPCAGALTQGLTHNR